MLGRKKNQNNGADNFNMPEFSIPELDNKFNNGNNDMNMGGSMNQGNMDESVPNNFGNMQQLGGMGTPLGQNNKSKKQPKAPKQPKMPKQVGQEGQMGQMNQFGQQGKMKQPKMPKQSNSGKKPPIFIIFIVLGLIFLLIAGFIIRGFIVGNTTGDSDVTTNPEQEIEEILGEPDENINDVENSDDSGVVGTENDDEEIVENPEDEDDVISEPKFSFENDMLGIKFNYDPNLYIKENTEEIFNMITQIIPPERNTFNIFEDALPDSLIVARLTTGDSDGLYVSISIVPFTIEKETKVLRANGDTDVLTDELEAVSLTDEELVEKYDIQIKDSLKQSGCNIVSYDVSTVKPIGSEVDNSGNKVLKGIMTSRVYTGPVDVTSSTGTVDLVQCTIPVGKNAIVITAVTDGRPIEIDKTIILNEIVDSIVVKPLGVEEEKETGEISSETTSETENTGETLN